MRTVLLAVVIVTVLARQEAGAMFMIQETEKVPIGRLFTNLQGRLATNAADYQLHYQLARLHAMAFSTNVSEMPVAKSEGDVVFGYPGSDNGVPVSSQISTNIHARTNGLVHLTNAIAHYEIAIALMKKSTNENEVRWLILPTQLGYAWCLQQSGRREDALNAYRKVLAIAWRMEVTGQFKFDEWVKDVWEDVKSLKNPLRSRQRGYIGPGVCFSQEAIGYLLKLLDPVKDAKEIADLKEKQKTLNSMGRAITPILIPLEDSPIHELIDVHTSVSFDLDGSGMQRNWRWITPKAAWLAYDAEGNGQITSGLQMFGNVTFWIFWRDGYQALDSLDDDGNGLLSGSELRNLVLWRDANCNGLCEKDEIQSLERFGIQALDCRSESAAPALRWSPQGVRFKDGSSRPSYDWTVPQSETTPAD